ncbi:unnamed protein product [Urochloa humidicola]
MGLEARWVGVASSDSAALSSLLRACSGASATAAVPGGRAWAIWPRRCSPGSFGSVEGRLIGGRTRRGAFCSGTHSVSAEMEYLGTQLRPQPGLLEHNYDKREKATIVHMDKCMFLAIKEPYFSAC